MWGVAYELERTLQGPLRGTACRGRSFRTAWRIVTVVGDVPDFRGVHRSWHVHHDVGEPAGAVVGAARYSMDELEGTPVKAWP